MANSFDKNITEKLSKTFLEKFETARVLSKNVDTQFLKGEFDPSTGTTVYFRRPTDYVTKRTSDGDISSGTRAPIITSRASGTVQDMFTVDVEYKEVDQALKMDKLDELLAPMATRIVTDLEVDFAKFMMKNAGLLAGVPGNQASTWDHIAAAGATMQAHGVPMDRPWCYAVNPFTQTNLASNQRSLGAGGSAGALISEAHRKAIITEAFAGFDKVMTATTLGTVLMPTMADLVGALDADPDVTYATNKDTLIQSIAVKGLTASVTIPAGAVVKITGNYRLNLSTRQLVLDATAGKLDWTATVTADAVVDGTGDATLLVAGPAIYESGGAYNTVDSAPVEDDVVTILNPSASLNQPNLFWHKQAFGIGSIPIEKLYSTDTLAKTEDGMQMRVSKYADGDKNLQVVRFDFRAAYACFNPFFAGQGFGPA